MQLQTQDQRAEQRHQPERRDLQPDAGASCYRYPAVSGLDGADGHGDDLHARRSPPSATPPSSTIPTRNQVTGIQWQVNSANGTGTCTVELRIDNITFQ